MALPVFKNEPFTDFSRSENKEQMQQALVLVKQQFGATYPLVIGGQKLMTKAVLPSYNPANLQEVIGSVAQADQTLIDQAFQAASSTFETWRYTSAEQRAGYLLKAAAILRRRKFEFSAWMVYETGKNWAEADGDTAEAIDFLEFYAREMIRLARPQDLTPLPSEQNQQIYIPLGVGIIIPPWNFPLAILAGMTTAAIVAGNTVLLKPSPNASVVAAKFMAVMEEVGLPAGVINFVPGPPEKIGDYMTEHATTRFVSFTGSSHVGMHIIERTAKRQKGQNWIKRVVAEMGGKDAIVVDKEANLEEAASAIVASAFGFQGQKCSAASRAIIHKDVYDEMVTRILAKTKQLKLGTPAEDVAMGPLIDERAYAKVQKYIEIGKQEATLALGGNLGSDEGYFIEPTIFVDCKSENRIMQEEIFGPVLAIARAESFEDAVAIFNDTEYGLTGSLFTYDRSHLEYAKQRMHCGNLYFNRKCTGALVGVHPFGGFNMSGTDSKAGGYDYLLQFLQAKVVSERF